LSGIIVINVPWVQALFILQRRTTSKDQTMNAKKNSIDAPEKVRVRRRDIKNAETEIGLKLRALYASVQEEQIPARFLDLLEKLDEAERNHTHSSK
jgi:anti-sigma factor NepR-like protein